jgi:hypothetical protein
MTVDANEGGTGGRAADEHWRTGRPRAEAFMSPRATGWTPAHSEVARFIGECFAVGAVLGFATELARPLWDQRHG